MPTDPAPAGHVVVLEDDADMHDVIQVVFAHDGYAVPRGAHRRWR